MYRSLMNGQLPSSNMCVDKMSWKFTVLPVYFVVLKYLKSMQVILILYVKYINVDKYGTTVLLQ